MVQSTTVPERKTRKVHIIRRDGFCFIKAVLKCLKADHGVIVDYKEAIQIITEQLIDHHDKYVEYHTTVQHNDPRVTDSDLLLSEAMDFFQDRQYTKDVVDLLVQFTTDALCIDILIHQNHNRHLKILKYSGGPISKPVYMKFTRNDRNPAGNHYDAIIKDEVICLDEEDGNLHMLSTIASMQSKLGTGKGKSAVENKQIFKSPTSTTTVSNPQTINSQIDIDLVSNEQIFSNKVHDIKINSSQILIVQ